MNLTPDNVIALTPAAPGWTVTVIDTGDKTQTTCPLIGWAVVIGADAEGRPTSSIEPAFYYPPADQVWTPNDIDVEDGFRYHRINPPEGRT
ncbi:hypothetical protein [Microbispora sp. CSR-4]|uniref:hypothetical protein n=1 Tax=Microbispora sp. CSR-4 TaxID=2592813 RepID=UPI0011C7A793|nr:hypothetical protein [Microbispora sp. CSR-4]